MNSNTTHVRQPGFVRPRFDDGTFEDPLPLGDHFAETFLDPHAEPVQLALIGPRGSGLTTTLQWLAEQVTGPRYPLFLSDLLRQPDATLAALNSGLGVLFLDTSVTPVAPCAWRAIEQAFAKHDVLRRSRLVIACPQASLRPGDRPDLFRPTLRSQSLSNPQRAYLAPWTDDDLLELLGSSPRYRERRAALFAALKGIRHADRVLARPRTARLLLDAAEKLDPREEVTLGRLYANVLDTLSPWTLELLQGLEHDRLRAGDLKRLLDSPPPDADEAAAVLMVPRALAAILADPAHELIDEALRRGFISKAAFELAREAAREQPGTLLGHLLGEFGELTGTKLLALVGLAELDRDGQLVRTRGVELALPGLHHFLQAGHCLSGVALGELPDRVSPRWFPFVPELWTPGLQTRLEARLADPLETHGAGIPASLLWAAGVTPPLNADIRRLNLEGGHLAEVSLPGAILRQTTFGACDLRRARLEGADLSASTLRGTQLASAVLDGADLIGTSWVNTDGARVSLRGARLDDANLGQTNLSGAQLQGVQAPQLGLMACDLRGAQFERAHLVGAQFLQCDVREASFAHANLENAIWHDLDLRTVDLRSASLCTITCERCNLADAELDGLDLRHALFLGCDLSATRFRDANLRDGLFTGSRAHEAVFDGADLRGAVFKGVNFHAGSSRSGLLQGPASEGTRTGYYTEGTTDDAWASPESLRVASFRGADLRGARFERTDMFRLDLRDARLDSDLRAFALKAGAILD